jgi:DMSO/TMAO reductase YedYZ heme-binding membrane subunit
MFAVIGLADTITASITGDFAGGVIGRVAGHSFLVVGLFIILLALPLLATANTPAQRKPGKYWKRLHRMTYVIWGLLVLHLLLLDGFMPFGGPEGDGDPVMHQRFYQAIAISIPLIVLRLPPVRRWIADQRAAGRQRWVYLAFLPLAVLFILGFAYIVNEEIFTGTMVLTMRPAGQLTLDRRGTARSAPVSHVARAAPTGTSAGAARCSAGGIGSTSRLAQPRAGEAELRKGRRGGRWAGRAAGTRAGRRGAPADGRGEHGKVISGGWPGSGVSRRLGWGGGGRVRARGADWGGGAWARGRWGRLEACRLSG